jgi:uncharacterized membrane protein YccC
MELVTLDFLTSQLALADQLHAGRSQDLADVIKLIQTNSEQIAAIRQHLAQVHADYAAEFDRLVQRAHEEAGDASGRSTDSGA